MFEFDKAVREAPLHTASSLAIALADWLVFGLNLATTMHSYWLINVSTGLIAGALVALAQVQRAKDNFASALLKAGFAAVVVIIPLPVAGTAVALGALTWAWMSAVSRDD